LAAARVLAAGWMKRFCTVAAEVHLLLRAQRLEAVVRDFLPAFAGNRLAAEQAARQMHRNFASKLVDLWCLESGVPASDRLTKSSDLEIIPSLTIV
jgi:hypothetical protein